MSDPYKGKLAGHKLLLTRMCPQRWSLYLAECECGRVEGSLITASYAREWHRQHKADMIDNFVANGVDDRGREVHL